MTSQLRTVLAFLSIIMMVVTAESTSTCTVWGDPHLVGFAVDPNQAGFRAGYWCQWAGRMLILKNEFIEFYVNVTDTPFWNEYYEISLLSNGTTLCTITPVTNNCHNDFVFVLQPRNSQGSRQIFYDFADGMEITITSQWAGTRLIYNIEVTQSYDLIHASTGLCVTRLRECIIETSPIGKRSTDVAMAYDVCDIFIDEANKTAQQITGNARSQLITQAREACVSDIILTSDISWGESAAWLVLTDSIREAGLSSTRRNELLMELPSNIASAVSQARPRAETILGISTTTTTDISQTTYSITSSFNSTSITTTQTQTLLTSTKSSSNGLKFNIGVTSLLALTLWITSYTFV